MVMPGVSPKGGGGGGWALLELTDALSLHPISIFTLNVFWQLFPFMLFIVFFFLSGKKKRNILLFSLMNEWIKKNRPVCALGCIVGNQ